MSEQVKGLKQAIAAERQKRQQSQQEIKALNEQIKELEKALKEVNQGIDYQNNNDMLIDSHLCRSAVLLEDKINELKNPYPIPQGCQKISYCADRTPPSKDHELGVMIPEKERKIFFFTLNQFSYEVLEKLMFLSGDINTFNYHGILKCRPVFKANLSSHYYISGGKINASVNNYDIQDVESFEWAVDDAYSKYWETWERMTPSQKILHAQKPESMSKFAYLARKNYGHLRGRDMLNAIRHNLTPYDQEIKKNPEMRNVLKARYTMIIGQELPELLGEAVNLAQECLRAEE